MIVLQTTKIIRIKMHKIYEAVSCKIKTHHLWHVPSGMGAIDIKEGQLSKYKHIHYNNIVDNFCMILTSV